MQDIKNLYFQRINDILQDYVRTTRIPMVRIATRKAGIKEILELNNILSEQLKAKED